MKKNYLISILCMLLLCVTVVAKEEPNLLLAKLTQNKVDHYNTPVAIHGGLQVRESKLIDSKGNPIQLRGLSTHGLAWFPEYVNKETFKYLRDEWHINCIRLALYTDEYGGYCSGGDKENLKQLIHNGISYATDLGLYVIVDWHVLSDQNPLKYKDEAIQFFNELSSAYKDYDNIIYEICNEPNGTGTWEAITNYANAVIPTIRKNDPNAIVLVGTPTWSQEIDKALEKPLQYDNIMYTLHFYAGTHTQWLRERMQYCIDKKLPIFISEFGLSDASGNGNVDIKEGNAWKALIEKNNMSYICWNLSNKDESSSIIKANCEKLYGWNEDELSTQGKWIKEWLKSESENGIN